MQEHTSKVASDRADIARVLQHPDVKAAADGIGLDLRRAQDEVATLDLQDLRLVAEQSRQVERALVGGQSRVTLSTTAIIIGLLVLILIIVAVD